MKERLGEAYPAFLASYEDPPYKGLRVNTLKLSVEAFSEIAPFPLGARVPWDARGFYHSEEKAGADPYHFAGLYYLQEPSAMCMAGMIGEAPRVLDLCAAPGGKTAMLATAMAGKGILVSNEIDGARARILSQNVERLGIRNCAVTSAAPARLAEIFPAYFDLIVTDAPCSGEGMFKKEPEAIPHWSLANVEMCAARQREILEEAAQMLAAGGTLVYSTCTFAEEEDERQVEDFLRRHPEFRLERTEKLYPHSVKGEGHFAAMLRKEDGGRRDAKPYPVRRNLAAEKAYRAFAEEFFAETPQGEITTLADGRMYLVPAGMPALDVRVLRLGVELGEWDGKRFKPVHALAMACGAGAKRKVRLSREEAKKYLRGETLQADADGWCVVCVEEFPLGLGKAVGGTVKNHLPKGLRMVK